MLLLLLLLLLLLFVVCCLLLLLTCWTRPLPTLMYCVTLMCVCACCFPCGGMGVAWRSCLGLCLGVGARVLVRVVGAFCMFGGVSAQHAHSAQQ